MVKEEKLNEEAALNNNLGSSTLKANEDIAKEHQKPKLEKQAKQKKTDTKVLNTYHYE